MDIKDDEQRKNLYEGMSLRTSPQTGVAIRNEKGVIPRNELLCVYSVEYNECGDLRRCNKRFGSTGL